MMPSTKEMTMRFVMTWLFICAAFLSACASAVTPEGTWKFERSIDYLGRTPVNQAPRFPTLVIHNNEVRLSDICVAKFASEEYLFSDVFQPLTKQGTTEKQVDAFLLKNLNLSLSKTREVFSLADTPGNCSRPMMEFFMVGDRMLVPVGATFYTYVKAQAEAAPAPAAAGSPVATLAAGYKLSKLPLDFDRYYSSCLPKLKDAKGQLRTSDKCAPDYFPYVADPKSADPIMQLVGNHDYAKWGQEYTAGFSPPFKQKVPATFMVFAPMKQVTLVRVDDFGPVLNEERDVMTGVYLSIVNGKVVDQISGCHFNRDYVCLEETRPVANLTDSGKFQKLN